MSFWRLTRVPARALSLSLLGALACGDQSVSGPQVNDAQLSVAPELVTNTASSVGVAGISLLVTPPALPQVYLNTPYVPATGNSIYVGAGGNLQAALNNAQRGDEIVLQAGATFTGNFTLPAKPGTAANGWIVIRSDKLSQLPPEGTRVTNANAHLMPKIVTPNYTPAIATALSASGWRLAGLEITVDPSFGGQQYGLIFFGDGSPAQNTLSVVATDLVLDRSYVHGASNTEMQRCIGLNSARTVITDSYIVECHGRTGEAQGINGYNGPGPYKIVNNTIHGSAENILWGGSDPWITGLIPSDIEIRQNYLYTPRSWKGVWLKKNIYESKASRRVLLEGNVFDGSWQDGQQGWAIILKAENQGGRCTWCTTSDYTIRYNAIINSGAGINIAGREGSSSNPVGGMAARFDIQHNYIDSINVGPFQGDARMVQILTNAYDISVTNNTMKTSGVLNAFLYFDQYPSATRVGFNNNIVSRGMYGLFATGLGEGAAAFGAVAGGWEFITNSVIGPSDPFYPVGTQFITLPRQALPGNGASVPMLRSKLTGVVVP